MVELIQNQAFRLITDALKTTPIDAMNFTTGNKPIQELIKENATETVISAEAGDCQAVIRQLKVKHK
jgi:phosphoribosyl-ATP pyrophosphohydrolase